MSTALSKVNRNKTDQKSKAKKGQVVNNAGGFVFTVGDWDRLERFLIIGTDKGTYHAGEQKLTTSNLEWVEHLLRTDPLKVLQTVIDVSTKARAYKNSPAIFALALALNTVEPEWKGSVRAAVQEVCRTSTHLFEFARYLENLGGWGRAKRKAVAEWYTSKTPEQLAYQAVKYRQRDGWTHEDLMRLSHVKLDPSYKEVGNFILGNEHGEVPDIIAGFEKAQKANSVKQLVEIVIRYKLPWEAVPTEYHKSPDLWRALFEADQLGQTALLRNVTRLARLKMFDDMKFAAAYAKRLADPERIKKGKLHPINYLNAAVVYTEGQFDRSPDRWGGYYSSGARKAKDWTVSARIREALNKGFYAAFATVTPSEKRTLIGVDVSGSMSWSACGGIDLTAAQVSGAMALITAKMEPFSMVRGFSTQFVDLGIGPDMLLNDAMAAVQRNNFGGTDCSLPMTWALKNKLEVEHFLVITDNETWAGNIHPFQALKDYRQKMGIDARLTVAGVASTDFTIADPSDRGMLDVVGFDASAPSVIADFAAGRL